MTKYRASQLDHLTRTLVADLSHPAYGGGVTAVSLAAGGCVTSWGEGVVRPQMTTIRLMPRDAFAAADVLAAQGWRLDLTTGGVPTFSGEVIQDVNVRGVLDAPEPVVLRARCGLARLEKIAVAASLVEARTLIETGPQSLLAWLRLALGKTGAVLPIEIATSRYPDALGGSETVLTDLYARPERWIEIEAGRDGAADTFASATMRDVLEDIVTAVAGTSGVVAQAASPGGCVWRIADERSLFSGAVDYRRYDGESVTTVERQHLADIDRAQYRSRSTVEDERGVTVARVTYDPGAVTNLIVGPNDTVSKGGYVYRPATLRQLEGERSFFVQPSDTVKLNAPLVEGPGHAVESAYPITISCEYLVAVPGDLPATPVSVRFRPQLAGESGQLYTCVGSSEGPVWIQGEWPGWVETLLVARTRAELSIPLGMMPEAGVLSLDLLTLGDPDDGRNLSSTAPPNVFTNGGARFYRYGFGLAGGQAARMFEASVAGQTVPDEAPDALDMRLGSGPGQRAPGSLLVLTTPDPFDPVFAVATQWRRSEEDTALLTLAEYEAREALILSRFPRPVTSGAVKLVSYASPASGLDDGDAHRWLGGSYDHVTCQADGDARQVIIGAFVAAVAESEAGSQIGRFGSSAYDAALQSAAQYVDADRRLARLSLSGSLAQTSEWIEAGTVTRIPFAPELEPQIALSKGRKISVQNARTADVETFVLAKRVEEGDQRLHVEPRAVTAAIPAESGIRIQPADLLALQSYTAEAALSQIKSDQVAELSEDLTGTVERLLVTPTREIIEPGDVLRVARAAAPSQNVDFPDPLPTPIDGSTGSSVLVTASQRVPAGAGVIPIRPIRVDAARGSSVAFDAAFALSQIRQTARRVASLVANLSARDSADRTAAGFDWQATIDAFGVPGLSIPVSPEGDLIRAGTAAEQTAEQLQSLAWRLEDETAEVAALSAAVAAGTVTSLPVTSGSEVALLGGDTVIVYDGDGQPVTFVVDGDHSDLSALTEIAVQPRITARILTLGARVRLGIRAFLTAVRQNAESFSVIATKVNDPGTGLTAVSSRLDLVAGRVALVADGQGGAAFINLETGAVSSSITLSAQEVQAVAGSDVTRLTSGGLEITTSQGGGMTIDADGTNAVLISAEYGTWFADDVRFLGQATVARGPSNSPRFPAVASLEETTTHEDFGQAQGTQGPGAALPGSTAYDTDSGTPSLFTETGGRIDLATAAHHHDGTYLRYVSGGAGGSMTVRLPNGSTADIITA